MSCLPSFQILITRRGKSEYLRKPSTNGSGSRNRVSQFKNSAIRLDPIHRRGLSDLETLTRDSVEHYANGEYDHARESMISSNKMSPSESSFLKANIRVRNEFVSTEMGQVEKKLMSFKDPDFRKCDRRCRYGPAIIGWRVFTDALRTSGTNAEGFLNFMFYDLMTEEYY